MTTHKDRPEVDENEEDEVQSAVNRKEECVKVVRDTLDISINGVERIGRPGRRNCEVSDTPNERRIDHVLIHL